MKIYREELEGAAEFWQGSRAPTLREDQLALIREKATRYERQVRAYPRLHNFLGLLTLFFILAADLCVLAFLPSWVGHHAGGVLILSVLHGYFIYGATVYTMHEGAGHNGIVRTSAFRGGEKKAWEALQRVVRNSCRLFFADPEYYRSVHPNHHAYLGTERDGAFTHFVSRRRFAISLLPFAGVLDFNDYKIHDSGTWTRSRVISQFCGLLYLFVCVGLLGQNFSPLSTLLVTVLFAPWFGFILDRLRETTDHHLMPQSSHSGARNLGPNFWGLLVGGGPWGQPCHFSHHLAPNLPWYHQISLHFDLKKILTPEQKELFLPNGFFPNFFFSLLEKNAEISRRVADRQRARISRTPSP